MAKEPRKDKHLTTITGPPAEAILRYLESEKTWTYIDKSVPGVPIVEVWVDC